jgi:hypothetical protein
MRRTRKRKKKTKRVIKMTRLKKLMMLNKFVFYLFFIFVIELLSHLDHKRLQEMTSLKQAASCERWIARASKSLRELVSRLDAGATEGGGRCRTTKSLLCPGSFERLTLPWQALQNLSVVVFVVGTWRGWTWRKSELVSGVGHVGHFPLPGKTLKDIALVVVIRVFRVGRGDNIGVGELLVIHVEGYSVWKKRK